ncbi:hypothetical protein ANRL1_01768 [Anaerolineae bacterium]|nr:hypothetical protein ANRL1_01768 [Anaerolineae bacterium]
MTRKEWTIISILGATVVFVFSCLACLILGMLTPTSTQKPALVSTKPPPTLPPQPTATRKPVAKGEIVIKDEKFIQHGQGLYWIRTLYNPGTQTVGSVYIYVDAFDSTDTVFDSNYEVAPCVYPGEIRKVVSYAKLPDKLKFGRYTTRAVSQSSGCAGMQFEQNPLSVISMEIQTTGRVVAVIGNSSDKHLRDVGVDALAYDSTDEYIGSTHPFLNLVPAHGKARIELGFFEPWGRISKVEIYPAFRSITRIE